MKTTIVEKKDEIEVTINGEKQVISYTRGLISVLESDMKTLHGVSTYFIPLYCEEDDEPEFDSLDEIQYREIKEEFVMGKEHGWHIQLHPDCPACEVSRNYWDRGQLIFDINIDYDVYSGNTFTCYNAITYEYAKFECDVGSIEEIEGELSRGHKFPLLQHGYVRRDDSVEFYYRSSKIEIIDILNIFSRDKSISFRMLISKLSPMQQMYHRLRSGDTVTPFKLNFVESHDLLEEDLDYLESQIRQESRLVNLTSFDYFLKDSKTQMLLGCELIRDKRRNDYCQKLNGDLHGISFTADYKDELEIVTYYFLGIMFRRFYLHNMRWFEEYDDYMASMLARRGCLPCY